MRILLVGDNRTNLNVGGRAASIALYDLLSRRHTVSSVVTGANFLIESAGYGYVKTRLAARRFLYLKANRHRRIYDWYVRLEEFFGAKDFIQPDPKESADNIIRYSHEIPQLASIHRKIEEADAVVIHGEGDLVFTTPPRRPALFLLGMIELGLRLEKKVLVVNTMLADCGKDGEESNSWAAAKNLLTRCEKVLVRDSSSLELLQREVPDCNSALVPDSVFSWFSLYHNLERLLPASGDFVVPFPEEELFLGRLDFSKPYVCLGGGAEAATDRGRAVERYSDLFEKLKSLGLPIYLVEADGRDSFLRDVAAKMRAGLVPVQTPVFMCGAILANARLLISGRYHPAILAALGGTPNIFLTSTAHKMLSLQEILEYPKARQFSTFPDHHEIRDIVSLANSYLNRGEALREGLRQTAGRRAQEAEQLPEHIEG